MTNYSELEEVQEGRPPSESDDSDTTSELVTYYWRLLREYYWVILLSVAATVTGVYFWTKNQKKVYAASSKIVYHDNSGNVFGRKIEQVNLLDPGGRWEFEQFWNTQKQVFKSRWFAKRVVKSVGLVDRPEFMPDIKPSTKGGSVSRERKVSIAARKVLGATDIRLSRESRVGIITVRLDTPEQTPESRKATRKLTAKIANAIADEYVEYTKEFQSGGLKKITNWFDSYVAKKKKDLEKAQKQLQNFKSNNNILSLSYEDRRNLTASNIETVNSKLMETHTELASQTALLEQIKALVEKKKYGAIPRLVDREDDTRGPSVFERRAKLKEKLSALKTRYGDNHPKVQTASNKLKTVEENIRDEIDQISSSIQNRVEMLRSQKSRLNDRLSKLKDKVFQLNELGVKYNQLQNRKNNLKELYDTVLKRSSELNINSLYQPQDIEPLEKATVPNSPVAPSMPTNLAIGGLLGLLLGGGLTVLLDALDTTVRTREDITQYTDRPVLAMLPQVKSSVLRGVEAIGDSAADTITHTAPKSSFAEGVKTLRTNLAFMSPDRPPKLLLMTSPGPRQGKTLTTVNTAIATAQSGENTLIVDTDIRKPRIHKALNLSNNRGVSTVVTGDAAVDDVVQSTKVENLSAITSGGIPPNPSELLHSESFEAFVEDVGSTYDRVIFDSPPLQVVSDSLILSTLVDGVLLIAEFQNTRKQALQRSLQQLREIGAPLLGCILNEVPTSGAYSYEYYRYSYYGKYEGEEEPEDHRLAS